MATSTATLEMPNELEISNANPPHSCITKEFVCAGAATFTIECSPDFIDRNPACKPHYTFKVTRKEDRDGVKSPLFVSLLTGPDNEDSYTYCGILNEAAGKLFLTKASKLSADSFPVKILTRAMLRIFAGEQHLIEAAGFAVHHVGKCCRCGRALTTPESVRLGVGPECFRIMQEGK